MPPPPMLLLPRLGLVAGGAKPTNTFNYSLGLDLGRRRHSSSPPSIISSSRRLSCNAEQPNGAGTRSRRWWSDEAQFDEDYDDEFDDDYDEEASFGSAREMFDEPWFTKALRAYGYVLPLILVSMLVATGPQAFLMAMAIPLAQSAVSFSIRAFSSTFGRRDQEVYGDDYYSDYRSGGWEEPEQEEYSSTKYTDSRSRSRSQQRQQQPWAKDGKSEDSEPKGEPDDTDSATGSGRSAGFGGWDELDSGDDYYYRSSSGGSRRSAGPSPAADTTTATNAATGGASRSVRRRRRPQPETTTRRGRSRAAARYRQSPLLMRLLVAVFPFLGSWFRIML